VIRRLAFVAALALVAAQSAAAHAIPLETSPASGAVVASPPNAAYVTFDSIVRPGTRAAAVDAAGQSILQRRVQVLDGRTLVIPLRPGLGRGNYTVRWSIVSDDGHEEEGLIAFAVGIGSPTPVPALTVQGYLTWQRILMRTLFFLGVLGAAGVIAFTLLVVRPLGLDRDLLRREANLLFAFFLVAFCGADALTHTAGVAGTRFEFWITVAAVAAGIGCVTAALTPVYRWLRSLAWSAAGVLFVCPTLAGHALDASQPRLLAPVADLLHLGGSAVWVGGLTSLWASARRLPAADRPRAVRRFTSAALPAVGVVAVAGASRALTELSSVSQAWSTGYGRALLVKSGLLVATLAVAWLNRASLAAGLDRATRLFPVELVLLTLIVVAVGTLTDLAPGRVATSPLAVTPSNVRPPPPPPPAGAFVDARQAGRYAVTFAYRKGVAVIRVVGPDGRAAAGVPVTVEGHTLVSCGLGCFSTPLPARSASVTAAGKRLQFIVPQRLRRAAAELQRVTRAFEALGSVVLRERLASAPGREQVTIYRERAPDRLAYRVVSSTQPEVAGSQAIVIGGRRWDRRPGGQWIASAQYPISTPTPFWGPRSRNAYFVAPDQITFFDPAYPAWFRLRFDPATGRTVELQMVASSHFMVHTYSDFDRSPAISPPPSR
jgi:copper transport protein